MINCEHEFVTTSELVILCQHCKTTPERVIEDMETERKILKNNLKTIEFGKYNDGCPVCGFTKHHRNCWFDKFVNERV